MGVCLLVPAEEVLDACARSGQTHTQSLRFLGDDLHALEQRSVALPQLAGGGERLRTCQQQLDAPLVWRIGREEAQRGAEPACGARRSALGGRLAGLS